MKKNFILPKLTSRKQQKALHAESKKPTAMFLEEQKTQEIQTPGPTIQNLCSHV